MYILLHAPMFVNRFWSKLLIIFYNRLTILSSYIIIYPVVIIMKQTTSERLKLLLSERKLRQADVLEKIQPYCEKYGVKIPRNALSQYITGKVVPKQDKLAIIGMALDVSEAWLMGFDVPIQRQRSASVEADQSRAKISKLFTSLTDENQKKLLDYAQLLLTAQQAERDSQE